MGCGICALDSGAEVDYPKFCSYSVAGAGVGWLAAELAALKAAAAVRSVADQGRAGLVSSHQRGRALFADDDGTPRADRQPRLVVGGCDDVVMSSTASSGATVVSPAERVEVLFDELAELAGQRNGIDGRIVEIVAELDRDELCGATGARSIAALVAWKMGSSIGQRQHDRHRRAPARGVPALRPRHARGPTVAGSGRRHRRPGGPGI